MESTGGRQSVEGSQPPIAANGQPHGLARGVDRSLPWIAGGSALAGVLVTALSDVPAHLPGIALDSSALFLVERGGAVVAALIVATGLVGRTLKRELPTGFSPATGSLTYSDKIVEAASASDAAAAALKARLDKQDADLARQSENIGKLARALDGLLAEVEKLRRPPDPPAR